MLNTKCTGADKF